MNVQLLVEVPRCPAIIGPYSRSINQFVALTEARKSRLEIKLSCCLTILLNTCTEGSKKGDRKETEKNFDR
jgi:hypothetical protein